MSNSFDTRRIITVVTSIRFLSSILQDFLYERFGFNKDIVKSKLQHYTGVLRDDLYVLIEAPYVDKVYRNSFYTYYSSKHTKYERDCLRLAFFDSKIEESDFFDSREIHDLKRKFLGFMVLRPLLSRLVGRTTLSPKAFKERGFYCCTMKTNASINGIKMNVEGFPHSSQDKETITCAETTLWSVMEYFGNRYAEYTPILPSTIIETLASNAYERQTPSVGLQIPQMSFALKQFGFGVKIYAADSYGIDFKRILKCYLKSGIPVIAAIENDKIHHAVVYAGLGELESKTIDTAPVSYIIENGILDLQIIDVADLSRELVVIDDNFPAYRKTDFDDPTKYYPSKAKDWKNSSITSIVVPLYHKIYLDAPRAKALVLETLSTKEFGILEDEPILLNFFLASSRSYKDEMIQNESLGDLQRSLIMYTSMPKFIWVAELSTKELFKKGKGNGFIILDATATNQELEEILILVVNRVASLAYIEGEFQRFFEDNELKPFDLYKNNLKHYKNG